jgi:hypothetical protein
MSTFRRFATASAATSLLLSSALVGCGDDDDKTPPDPTPTEKPAYSLATTVSQTNGAVTYVSLFDSLDITSLDLTKASEHSGYATIGAVEGQLFVGDGEKPEISRFTVGDDGSLVAAGRISFANYGFTASAPLYLNQFVDSTRAYMSLEESRRVVWNPTTMQISGTADAPGLVREREGLVVKTGFDRARVTRGNDVFQAFYWTDGNYFDFLPTSQIAVYSKANDSLVKLLDAPCPGLDVETQDEAGNLYFSNWVFSSAAPLLKDGAPDTCVVRIKAGETELDAAWTRSLSSLVGGRQTAAFRYLGNDVGVVAVFHHENVDITPTTAPGVITGGLHWKLWRVNLASNTATPIDELGFIAGGYYAFTLEGRTFLLLPTADYARTAVWELGVSGTPVKRFEVQGWAYQFLQVR